MNKPVMEEIATTADGRDITRGYVDGLPLLAPTDSVLQTRSSSDYRLYDEVLRDTQVKSCLQQRKLALIAKEWVVEPGDSSRKARKAAEHLEEVLNRIGWDECTMKMLSGVFYGFAVSETIWATDGGLITIDTIKVRKQRRFGFAPDGELKLLTSRKPLGEPVPMKKFWAFSCGGEDDDDPYGLGLGHWLYWPTFFKRNGIKFWLIFLEKFGMPTAIGKYPPNASDEEKNRLLQALGAIQTDSGIRIPEGMVIELLEASRSGTADYTALYDRMDAAIAKVVLGHTGSTDATPGRLGGESNASEVRDDLIKADADLICASFNRTVAKWLTEYNDPTAPVPHVWRRVESEPDQKMLADRDKVLFDMGFRPTLKYVTETYGGEWMEKPADPLPPALPADSAVAQGQPPAGGAPPAPDQAAAAASFADVSAAAENTPPIDTVDRQSARLQADSAPLIEAMLEPVRGLLKESSDLGEFRDGLARLYPQMDTQVLAEQMAEAFLAAELAGRYELQAGSDAEQS
jgi:phage gp29-like protein